MIPTRLTLLNFMCYRGDAAADESPALNLDGLHVVCLSGENGAGKSALLDAITWALWGAARMPDDDLIAQGASEMRVELEFQLGDQRYRVRRARQRGGTGKRGGQTPGKSQLDLQVRDGAGWRSLSELTIRETQGRIDDLLRMSYQTFINASFLLQGRADEFTARTPAERKQVLAEILDLGEYAALEARAKERSKGLDDQLKGLRGEMGQLRQSAEQLPYWAQQVEQAETKVAALRAEAEGAEAERAAAADALGKLERLAERRKELLRGLEAQRAEQAGREREIDKLKAAIALAEQLIARRAEIATGMAQLRAARDERARLDGLRGRHYELQMQRQELKLELRDARDALRAQVDQAAQRRDALRERADRLPALRTEIAAAESRLAALAPLAAERERAEAARAAAEQLAARIRDMRQRRAELMAQIEKREDSLVAVRESRREMVGRLDRQLAEALRWQADLERAREAQALLAADEASLAALSAEDQQRGDLVARLRAECDALKEEAARLKERQALLDGGDGACPVCRSELGADGLAHVHAHYDEELQGRRDRFTAAKREADEAARLQKQGRAAIAALERAIGERRMLAARVGPLEQQAAQAEAWRAERDQLHEQLADLQRQIAERDFEPALQAELRALEADLALLGDLAAAEHERQMAGERLGELDAQLRERDRIEGTLEVSRRTLAETAQEVEALPEAERAAEQLAARLEAGDFAHEVRARGREIEEALAGLGYSDELLASARAAAEALEHWEEQERALAMAEQSHSRDRTILQQAEELRARAAAAIDEASREEALLAEQLRGLPQAQARVELAGRGLRERQDALQSAQNDLGQKQGIMKRAQADADRLAVLADQEQAFVQRHGLFAELAEAFGKKGVQAMLIDTAIPQIEDEANRLLGRMTDNQMHLSLDTQRDTKKGDTVETLEIRIADALGTRAYDAFSGGEAMRVNFAVRIALSRLLARRAGARLETLVIDEGFGTLDATGRERMVEAITSVQDDFRRIIVITHIDELKERFPAQIEITKTPLGSRWELR
jgi:exonuclease SbcC